MSMPDLAAHTSFQHLPLPDPTTHFRLLEILQCEPKKHVVCELTTWPVESAPSYHALSYTWGNQQHITRIILNGADLVVRLNCEYALRQAYASQASKYFWIDAICIDQENVQEKNYQVAMMGDVYRNAAHVFACVGGHADDSQFLFDFIAAERTLLSDIYSEISSFVTLSGLLMSSAKRMENPIFARRWLTFRCFFRLEAHVRERVAAAYVAFMNRPYFSRVWILQELFLAPHTSCVCGTDSQSSADLLAISLLVNFWVNDQRKSWHWGFLARQFVSLVFSQSWLFGRQKACLMMEGDVRTVGPRLSCLAFATSARRPLRLAEVLDLVQHFECADARDRLYGVLSLADWNDSVSPVPDYEKDSFEVAADALGVFLAVKECAPTQGTPVQWAARLCEIFHVSLQNPALMEALRVRSLGCEVPRSILEQYLHRNTDAVEAAHEQSFHLGDYGWQRGSSKSLRPRDTGVYDSHWLGIELRPVDDVGSRSLHAEATYLCCVKSRIDDSITVIVDEHRRIFAYAPKDTKAGDIYLQSSRAAVSHHKPLAIVLRRVQGGRYHIVGQAYFSYDCSPWVRLSLSCEVFRLQWQPEDLLLFHWIHINRSACAKSRDEMAAWLQVRVCANDDLLHIHGPLPGFDHMKGPPTHYQEPFTRKIPSKSSYFGEDDLLYQDDLINLDENDL
ncbi:heterokaryon incompatibility protein-domain-containing protein [Paraphoma chrysanthemicola]|nr:heterokaryon incompatibility protein-domain-containing protein [Paraphoma chrysanthemicola]